MFIPQFENIDQVIGVKKDLLNLAKELPDITTEEFNQVESILSDLESLTDADISEINAQMEQIGMDINTGAEDYEPSTLEASMEALQETTDAMEISEADQDRVAELMKDVNPADPYGILIKEQLPAVRQAAETAAAASAAYTAQQSEAAAARAFYERARSPEARAAAAVMQDAAAGRLYETMQASQAAAARAAAEREYTEREQQKENSLEFLSSIGYQVATV